MSSTLFNRHGAIEEKNHQTWKNYLNWNTKRKKTDECPKALRWYQMA